MSINHYTPAETAFLEGAFRNQQTALKLFTEAVEKDPESSDLLYEGMQELTRRLIRQQMGLPSAADMMDIDRRKAAFLVETAFGPKRSA